MLRRRALASLALTLLLIWSALPAAARHRLAVRNDDKRGTSVWAGSINGLAVTSSGQLVLGHDAPAPPAPLGAYRHYGLFDSSIKITDSFRRVRVDYDASIPSGSELIVFVRGSADGVRWTEWEEAGVGETVVFDRVVSKVQHRAALLGNAASPALRALEVTPLPLSAEDHVVSLQEEPWAPTYKIRATREGLVGRTTANGHRIRPMDRFVSLPSWRSLSSRGGGEYMVRVTNPANGRSATAPVWDVGPWNRHDSYWNPDDREWYPDLPTGWSQDHAAYYDGHNGGRAEVGRVRWPSALDVGDGTWVEDLGIAFNNEQATVLVTFLWLGRDPGSSPTPQQPGHPSLPPAGEAPAEPAPEEPQEEGAVLVDDLDGGFARSDAPWDQMRCGHAGHAFWTLTTTNPAYAVNNATWRPSLPAEGAYDVYAYVPYCNNGRADTRDARYEIYHRDGVETVSVDQAARAGGWVKLGSWSFAAGDAGYVRLGDLGSDRSRSLWFDALKWVPLPAPPASEEPAPEEPPPAEPPAEQPPPEPPAEQPPAP